MDENHVEIPSLFDLCLQFIGKKISRFEKVPLILPPQFLSLALERAGSLVSPKILRLIEDYSHDDLDLLNVLEPFWEKICRKKFRSLIGSGKNGKPEEKVESWSSRFNELEAQVELKRQRSEKRMKSWNKEAKKKRKRNQVKLISGNARIPSGRGGGQVLFKTGLGGFSSSSSSSSSSNPFAGSGKRRQRIFTTDAPTSSTSAKGKKISKLLQKAARGGSYFGAKKNSR